MSTPAILAALSGLYAIFGNIVVYVVLIDRKIPVSFMWSGTPFYLYRVCGREPDKTGIVLKRFALSTNIAFFLTFALVFLDTVVQNH